MTILGLPNSISSVPTFFHFFLTTDIACLSSADRFFRSSFFFSFKRFLFLSQYSEVVSGR